MGKSASVESSTGACVASSLILFSIVSLASCLLAPGEEGNARRRRGRRRQEDLEDREESSDPVPDRPFPGSADIEAHRLIRHRRTRDRLSFDCGHGGAVCHFSESDDKDGCGLGGYETEETEKTEIPRGVAGRGSAGDANAEEDRRAMWHERSFPPEEEENVAVPTRPSRRMIVTPWTERHFESVENPRSEDGGDGDGTGWNSRRSSIASTMSSGRGGGEQQPVIYGGDEMDDNDDDADNKGSVGSGSDDADGAGASAWRITSLLRQISDSLAGGKDLGPPPTGTDTYTDAGCDDSPQREEEEVSDAGPKRLNLEIARTDYNSRIMPQRLIMIRHGQSEGNVEEGLYATTPDNAMRLTRLGWEQARTAGRALKDRVLNSSEGDVHFIMSPYVRTVETFHGLVSAWCDPAEEFGHIKDPQVRMEAWYARLRELGLTWNEDPRIREQDFGNYQDPKTIIRCKAERRRFGVFYYRFPHGESACDVFDRVSTFLDSLWRSFDLQRSKNYVLVTHGISIRVLLARYFRYSVNQFNMLANPKNCEMVLLGHDGRGRLKLNGRCELKLRRKEEDDGDRCVQEEEKKKNAGCRVVNGDFPVRVDGFRFHDKLRVLPRKFIDTRTIRLSCDD